MAREEEEGAGRAERGAGAAGVGGGGLQGPGLLGCGAIRVPSRAARALTN
jgi:hypothetical protein